MLSLFLSICSSVSSFSLPTLSWAHVCVAYYLLSVLIAFCFILIALCLMEYGWFAFPFLIIFNWFMLCFPAVSAPLHLPPVKILCQCCFVFFLSISCPQCYKASCAFYSFVCGSCGFWFFLYFMLKIISKNIKLSPSVFIWVLHIIKTWSDHPINNDTPLFHTNH